MAALLEVQSHIMQVALKSRRKKVSMHIKDVIEEDRARRAIAAEFD